MAAPLLGRFFAHNVAVDPGTASTLTYVRNRGVVLNQPSVVCFRKRGGPAEPARVEAVGEPAKALLGRSPEHLDAVRPLRHGVVAHYHAPEQMMRQFVGLSHTRSLFGRRVAFTLCVPSNATAAE
ncbi:rod shape-determining protein, partial [Burkholderia pseudomallei]|uniref:rod shape-determining protein n=1 Tax=Burkholderia pseudomallei TaxID=28450 RepID=UPI00406C40C4